MKKLLSLFAGLMVVATSIAGSPVQADDRPAFDVCSATVVTNCIQSFAIDGPGTNGSAELSKESYTTAGVIFNATGSGLTPTKGGQRFKVLVNNLTEPEFAGGTHLGQITIENPDATDVMDPSIDPATTFTVSVVTSNKFPSGAFGQVSDGSYAIDLQNGNYVFTVKAKPVDVIAGAQVTGYPAVFPNVATWEKHGVFSLSFAGAIGFASKYVGMPASTERAWLVVESNASSIQAPTWGNDTFSIGVGSPHMLMDGVTQTPGRYRIVMTNQMITDVFGMSIQQAMGGALVAQSSENGGALGDLMGVVAPTPDAIKGSRDHFMELNIKDFHYSSQEVKLKPSLSLKSSSMTWSGKKSTVKKKALTVKAAVKSNKKKAAGSFKVELVNAAGATAEALSGTVRKGSGKVTFSKAIISALPKGVYTVRMTFYGSETAKNTSKSYRLKIK